MRNLVSLTTRRISGSLNLRRSYTMPARMKLTKWVPLKSSNRSLKASMVQSCAMDRLVLVRLIQWLAAPLSLSTVVSCPVRSLNCTLWRATNLIRQSLLESVMQRFTTKRFEICFLMSRVVILLEFKTCRSQMIKEVVLPLKAWLRPFVIVKRKHWTACLRVSWVARFASTTWMLRHHVLIPSSLFMSRVALELNQLTKFSFPSFILSI